MIPYQPPPIWSVPREWPGERCLVICGGASVKAQREQIAQWRGRVVAVKHGVYLRQDADVLFFAGERAAEIAPPILAAFRGARAVVRGRGHAVFPETVKRVWRTTSHEQWSTDPTMVAGFDAGTSAINLAMLFGAMEIVVVGFDMVGGRWFTGKIPHYLPNPPESDFQRHMSVLPALASHAGELGVRIVNCSPISRVTCFERGDLKEWI